MKQLKTIDSIINDRKDINYKQHAELDLNLASEDCKEKELGYRIATRGDDFYTLQESNLYKTDN
jgi:hypothetical protein